MSIQYFTGWYQDKVRRRQKEYLYCLQKNLDNPLIDKVHLLMETALTVPKHPKLNAINWTKRPTYNDFFLVANDSDATICLIGNTDIYFDETLTLATCIKENECFALTRWDVYHEGEIHLYSGAACSQDTWIFRRPIRNIAGDFYLGKPGCDNRIAYEIASAGYHVTNPSKSIRSIHWHASGIRNYARFTVDSISPPYKTIPPSFL
ncbi:MAG: hypothetical protein SFW35_00775 [Chitinophagales bacterium]|nr:hypothetical protein [Chitinophagales bacterium]